MDLQCTTRRVGDRVVVALGGMADLASVPRLQDHLRLAVSRHPGATVAVELDGLIVLDDVALGLLLGAAARARELGGDLELICTDARMRSRLAAARFDHVVAVRDAIV